MRVPRFLAAVVALAAAPIAAFADSISPSSYSATIGIGESVTVTKTVTVDAGTPTSSKVDVFFLADTTGSMGGSIGAVISSASSILSATTGLGDVAWGVGEYKDFGDIYAYRLNTAITSTVSSVTAGIGMWAASGGGDFPEANLFGLHSVATDPLTGWRAGSARILVWFGDAPGHDPSGGATLASATADLVGMGIKVQALDVGALNSTGQALSIATATGGAYYSGISTSSIVAAITSAITTAFATYSSVGLDLSEVLAGVSAAYGSPVTGAFTRSSTGTFTFSLTFTGVTAGDYTFNIYGTVDGGRVATESDHIVVSAVPLPAAAWMGMGLMGLVAAQRRRRKNRANAAL